jgi:hypothetical protein
MAIEGGIVEVLKMLPPELSSKIDLLILLVQAIGGIFVVYVVFSIARFFMARREKEMIEEIRDDVRFIKGRLRRRRG